MSWPVLPQGFLGGRGTSTGYSDNDTYQIGRSLRFNSADTAYLSRTPSIAGNRKTWTFSVWVKRSKIGNISSYILGNAQAPTGTNGIYFGFGSDTLFFGDYAASGWDWYLSTTSVYRDMSAWYHVVAQYDTTQATPSERVKLYVNGVRLTAFDGASTYPNPNVDGRFNQASVEMAIGRLGTYPGNYFDGYMAEVNFIDGQALTPSSFGETDAITGRWKAKAYAGTYGTNGFYLPFLDNSGVTATTIGKDNSTYRMLTAQLNGTSNGIEKGGDLTGITNGKSGIVSMWCNFTAGASGNQSLWSSRANATIGSTLQIYRDTTGRLWLSALNSAGANILNASTANNVTATSGLYHIYCTWDLNVNNQVKIYVNGVDQALTISAFTNATIQYSVPNHGYGGFLYNPFVPTTPGMVGQLYVNYSTYLDPVTNISKFYNAGKPVSLGTSGEIPTGSSPIVYLDGDATSILTNRGTGGNFVAYGTLATGTTYEGVGSHYNNWTPNNLSVTPGSGNDSLTDSPSNYGAISTTLVDDTYQISKSLRFNSADSAYLSRTFGTPTNNRKWSISFWMKRGALGGRVILGASVGPSLIVTFDTSNRVSAYIAGTQYFLTTPVYLNTSAWYHFHLVFDSANATQSNRIILYVNGVQQTASVQTCPLDQNTGFNSASAQANIGLISGWYADSRDYFDGYLAEVNFIDGQALTPDSFGTRDINTYLWKPKAYTGTYGTNGFYLPFTVPTETAYAAYLSDASTNYNSLPGGNQGTTFQFPGDFTIEGWVKYTSATSGDTSLYVQEASGGAQYFAFNLSMVAGVYNIYLNNGSGPVYSVAHGITANEWAHVAMVRSGSTISLYTNGALRGTTTNSSVLGYANMTANNRFGGGISGVARSMSNFRITKSAVYTSNFTPPTTALTNIANTLVLTYQNSTARDNSSNNFTMSTTGAVSFSVDSPFNINSAVALDRSGSGNSWRANNISITDGSGNDSLVDSPTTNYGTLSTTLTDDTYQISRSLRFNSTDLSYLSRTPSVAGNRKTWTWSGWVKRAKVTTGTFYQLFGGGTGTGGNDGIFFDTAAGGIYYTHAAVTDSVVTTSVYRDPSAWYHIVFAVDTNQVTASDRIRIYVNGSEVKNFATANYPTQYAENAYINTTSQHRIGAHTNSGYYFDGYLAEVNFIDGQALTPDSFGVRDTKTYAWKPKAYAGTYGTNGFYLSFSNKTLSTNLTSTASLTAPFGGVADNAKTSDNVYVSSNTTTGSSFTFIQQDFGTATQLTRYSITNLYFTGGTSTFQVQYGDDPTWNTFKVASSLAVTGSLQNFSGNINGFARYVRLAATAFGTNGQAHVDSFFIFQDGLGLDSSASRNNWTPNNLSVTEGAGNDSLVDSPTYYGTLSTTPSEDTYQISRSLRFKGTNTSLSRTPTGGNRRTWTWSAWVKRSKLGISGDATTVQQLFNRNDVGGVSNYTYIYFLDDNSIQFLDSGTGSTAGTSYLTTKTKFTDTTNWYHIVLAVDTTQVTETNRVKLYVNGTLMTSFTSVSWPGINNQTQIGTLNVHHMGSNRQGSQFFGGYFAEVNFVDGQALAPESFGVRESETFLWKPKAYTGAYGTNGFYLPFTENTSLTSSVTGNIGLGKDFSGNTNFWSTDGGISVSTGATSIVNNDSFIDVPTYYGTDNGAGGEARGSYATMDPAFSGSVLSNGNLRSTASPAFSTLTMTSGKYYFEATPTTSTVIDSNTYYVGVVGSTLASYALSGNRFNGSAWVAFGSAFVSGDVIGVAVDISGGTVNFYKNNVFQGTQTLTANGTYNAFSNLSSSNTGSTFDFNFGQRAFRYAAPTGFKALRDYNKPPPQTGGALSGDYCTLNPLSVTSGTFTNGNLRYAGPGSWKRTNSTMSMSTGKWYYEVTLANAPFSGRAASTAFNSFGFSLSSVTDSAIGPGSVVDALLLYDCGFFKNFTGATTDGGTAFLAGDVLSVAVDLDANTFVFSRNNIPITSGTIGGTPGRTLTPCILSYSDQYGVMDVNFGQRPWAFGAPFGFKPLRDYNKPNIQTGGELRGDYCTFDSSLPSASNSEATNLLNGNLQVKGYNASFNTWGVGTIAVSSGKWYFELTNDNGSDWQRLGIISTSGKLNPVDASAYYFYYSLNGNKLSTGAPASYGATWTTGDVIGCALDLDNGKIWFSKNGSWQGSGDPITGVGAAFTGLSGSFAPAVYIGSAVANSAYVNFGQRQYVYPPPFGFKPLRDYNKLPTPTGGVARGNYATLNPLFGNTGGTITDGNLTLTHTGGANGKNALGVSSVAMSSGKWYCEFTNTAATTSDRIGIISSANTSIVTSGNPYFSQYADGYSAYVGGGTFKENNNTASAITNFGGSSPVVNDVYMVAVDLDSNKVWFGRNGSWANNGNPATGAAETYSILSGRSYYFACNTYLGDQLVANFGQRPWAYDAPFGFKPLCTTLLPQPIVQKSSKYMDVVTYTGTATGNTISGFGFSPDLVWVKSRSHNTNNNIFDTTRGATVGLVSNSTAAEYSDVGTLAVFNSNGFTLGGDGSLRGANHNLNTYVAWAWDKSPIAGMDIVGYVGDGNSGRAISHSLGVTPKMIIVKNRTTVSDWPVYHSSLAANNIVFLHLTQAQAAISTLAWGGVSAASSTTFTATVGNVDIRNVNKSGDNYIAYCFAEVEGFSKFGSYTGNGLVDGPFVYCGFRPRWILFKNASAAYHWFVYDTARNTVNAVTSNLYASASAAEQADASLDIVSNGFKLRSSTYINDSSNTIVFAAFAESPFKYSRAR